MYEKIKPRESTNICLIEYSGKKKRKKEKNDSGMKEIIKINNRIHFHRAKYLGLYLKVCEKLE